MQQVTGRPRTVLARPACLALLLQLADSKLAALIKLSNPHQTIRAQSVEGRKDVNIATTDRTENEKTENMRVSTSLPTLVARDQHAVTTL